MARNRTIVGLVLNLGGIALLVAVPIVCLDVDWSRLFRKPLPPIVPSAAITPPSIEVIAPATNSTPLGPADTRQACHDRVLAYQKFHPANDRAGLSTDNLVPTPDPSAASIYDNHADLSLNFAREIQPIFIDRCYVCHGPTRSEAGIRFDRRDTVFRTTSSGSAPVVPRQPANSSLIARITSHSSTDRMPQGADPLSAGEISKLEQWIASGANWPDDARHWAYVKPRAVRPPSVYERDWSLSPIDEFVLARLESEQISHSPAADRATMIRRLSLDLIGLPPVPDDVDQYLADESEDAVERLVDRLSSSPHFGEKWAIRWLDLARFADTNGFEFDKVRVMWLYRDWLIESLNQDMPFDRFTVEQIAGDLLPNASLQQKVATGFLRSSPVAPDILTNRFDMMVDRVNTFGATWLGLTFSCAQCHDHKFDPLTQKEYYQLFAIFNSSDDEVAGDFYGGASVTTESPLNGVKGSTLVLAERSYPYPTYLKVRGSPFVDGERVQPGFPGFLHTPDCGQGDRLSLACWLVDEDNPLTARVTINRLWESIFGVGLVRTSDDFGVRGDPPSHPDLLDWLARDFAGAGWSNKRMLRRIVGSATYRQVANVSADLLERDPQNRLLARAPRFRVDAELLRDIALAASGLLSENLGGPSVFPWQPPGTSERLEYAGFAWNVNTDENRYRRGLYTHWKRTALYPSFLIFDAPNRSGSCTRRISSTTPLQALVSLNDPAYFEAAVHLGRTMLETSAGSLETGVQQGFRLCVAREPTDQEMAALVKLYDQELQRLNVDINAAKSMLGVAATETPEPDIPRWAAYSAVANVLLNLDETMTKE